MGLSESFCIRCKTPSKTRETPPFPPISYPALAGLIGSCSDTHIGLDCNAASQSQRCLCDHHHIVLHNGVFVRIRRRRKKARSRRRTRKKIRRKKTRRRKRRRRVPRRHLRAPHPHPEHQSTTFVNVLKNPASTRASSVSACQYPRML